MKIIQLTASNVKRLKAVDITPDGTLQVVGGRNAQGKSSVLDSIWLALGGGKAGKETSRPIRDGEEKASVTLDLGELVVTRTWTATGTKLQVQNADGANYKSPQGMLDALVGQLSFDPLAFTRLSARDQRDALLALVDLDVDLDALAADRQHMYDRRAELGRQGKQIGEVSVDSSLPVEETSFRELATELQRAQAHNRDIEVAQDSRTRLTDRIAQLESDLASAKSDLANVEKDAAQEPIDTAEINARLESIEDTNAKIRTNNQAKERAAEKDRLRSDYTSLTQQIEALDKQKADALSAAKFPVDGLAFDEQGVTYQGVPFSQASSAEQIKVSLGMGMALNPKLRVLVIKDGSLLDDDAMTAIREVVQEQDFQLWIERVGDADQGAVVLEDGEVRA